MFDTFDHAGHERHRRRPKRLDGPDAGADAAEQSLSSCRRRSSSRSACRSEAGRAAQQIDRAYRIALTRPATRAGNVASRSTWSRSSRSSRSRTSCSIWTSSYTRGDRCRIDAAGNSGIDASFCFNPAAGSAGWRWRICSIGTARCRQRRPSPIRARRRPSASTRYAPKSPHFKPRATAVISLFMGGGWSQVDTFDHKPALAKYAGQPIDGRVAGDVIVRQGFPGPLMPSPFKFKQYGQSGIEVSEIFPHLSQHVDEIAFLRSVYGRSNDHVQAHLRDADGPDQPGISQRRIVGHLRPGLGSIRACRHSS